ncbi:hypothetical protein MVES1_000913 [Malassezia vespertilionis]|uniref:uncharacterized protein n=1 Tax=Malassezia vespertilionis TaxID=2020962 RepID=UPI0024B10CB1|nr:uncharacterized protein MVES1_000913 [Malassezia vespertilionis]WFD05583.1 hypothetical protein MVES1_000913 [Malassezia vespertilionis]
MPWLLQDAAKVKASIGSSKEARCAFDGDEETVWTVELGSPSISAHVLVASTLSAPRRVETWQALECIFAGGFSPIRIVTLAGFAREGSKEVEWIEVQESYPRDGNMQQSFAYEPEAVAATLRARGKRSTDACTHIALRLDGSTDGFGRVIVYRLNVLAT